MERATVQSIRAELSLLESQKRDMVNNYKNSLKEIKRMISDSERYLEYYEAGNLLYGIHEFPRSSVFVDAQEAPVKIRALDDRIKFLTMLLKYEEGVADGTVEPIDDDKTEG